MTNIEKEVLALKRTIPFSTIQKELLETGKLTKEESDQLNEIWNFIFKGPFWNGSDLSDCCKLAEKAAKEKFGLCDEFIQKVVSAAAYEWK